MERQQKSQYHLKGVSRQRGEVSGLAKPRCCLYDPIERVPMSHITHAQHTFGLWNPDAQSQDTLEAALFQP